MSSIKFNQLLSEKEAAAYLSISVSTLRRWRRATTGPETFRVGDIIRYSTQSLDDFIARNSSPKSN